MNRPVYHGANGTEVHYHANGQPGVVRTHGMVITHTLAGGNRSEFVRADHSVVVSNGRRFGYVQRPFAVGGVSYVQRTYVSGGRTYVNVYRPYMYHGIGLNIYVAPRYYSPAFYGWAYSPWARPIPYSFGWGGSPWFGYYGYYFAPYPMYYGPAFWLTDYMVAMSLQDAYAQGVAASQAPPPSYTLPGGQTGLTPDVKQQIADEVHRQLDEERMESQAPPQSGGAPEFLTDNSSHIFVVANALDVQGRSGECALTEGDVLQMAAPPSPNAAMADLAVLASKGQDCRKGTVVSVAIPDLTEMQNHMREVLDQGLADLQSRQGKDGIPPEPTAANRPPVNAPYVNAAPPPEPNVQNEISQESDSADRAETDAVNQAQNSPTTNTSAPSSVTLGMSTDQVVGILGQPQVVADLGAKKTYYYGNMKVIFSNGKVSDIQ